MITQTLALLLDAYRELNAKKLFWITMILSGLVVAIYAAVGIDKEGVSFLWFRLSFIPITSDVMAPAVLYKTLFVSLGINIWLTWIAAILALVSTAGMFPDLIAGGSIETMLSKPIGRTRLFLTKYVCGLLFAALQVTVFSVASFLVIGLRAGVWEPGIFLAIPIVTVFFSYLFCICALLGLLTRSTIAALLLTILLWGGLFLVNLADVIIMDWRVNSEIKVEMRTERIERMESNTVKLLTLELPEEEREGYVPTRAQIEEKNPFLASQQQALEKDLESRDSARFWSGLVVTAKTVVPKTQETVALLEKNLIDLEDVPTVPEDDSFDPGDTDIEIEPEERQRRLTEAFRGRTLSWVLGTSLAFEAVILAMCCWIFRRRDF